jgi:shikimate dehydrogenase
MTPPAPRRAAVLGHPVAHSLSPTLHRAAYAALGLDHWSYAAVDLVADDLPAFVSSLDDSWAGLSLTMPHKQVVLPLLDHVEPLAQVVGAVNTVLISGSSRTLVGANTDVYGLVAALREGLSGPVGTAAVIGAGATAASTLAALGELGCTTPVVYVRSMQRAGGLMRAAHRMGVSPDFRALDRAAAELGRASVVVSTLPPHAADPLAAALVGPVSGVLLDVAYDPRPTALHSAWVGAGGVAVGGERMLLHQAVEQVRLMTGHPGPLPAMDAALESRLGESG